MTDILNIPLDDRDEKWEDQFFAELPKSQFEFLSETPIQAPDGLPYLPIRIAEEGEPAEKVLQWLGEKGVGLAINPDKEQPDYVFSYGMIWNFLTTGSFISEDTPSAAGGSEIEMEAGQEMMAGTPSETYFPTPVRKIFREFLKEQAILNPKIVMLSQDGVNYDLCFSLESLGNPPQEEWNGILQGFSWFFPLHYSFSILSENAIQGIDFIDL